MLENRHVLLNKTIFHLLHTEKKKRYQILSSEVKHARMCI